MEVIEHQTFSGLKDTERLRCELRTPETRHVEQLFDLYFIKTNEIAPGGGSWMVR